MKLCACNYVGRVTRPVGKLHTWRDSQPCLLQAFALPLSYWSILDKEAELPHGTARSEFSSHPLLPTMRVIQKVPLVCWSPPAATPTERLMLGFGLG